MQWRPTICGHIPRPGEHPPWGHDRPAPGRAFSVPALREGRLGESGAAKAPPRNQRGRRARPVPHETARRGTRAPRPEATPQAAPRNDRGRRARDVRACGGNTSLHRQAPCRARPVSGRNRCTATPIDHGYTQAPTRRTGPIRTLCVGGTVVSRSRSRARDRAELVTDDRAALREQLEPVTGERIAALEAVEPERVKGCEAGLDGGRSPGRESDASPTT